MKQHIKTIIIVLLLLALLSSLLMMDSAGSPLTAPLSPPRRHNPDILLCMPAQLQKARAFFAAKKRNT